MTRDLLRDLRKIPVFGWPVACASEDYDEAIKAYLAKIPQKGVVGVLQIGGVSHPGVSDIDLIVVFKSDFKSSVKKYRSNILNANHRYLMMHDPWFVDEEVLKKFSLLLPFFSCSNVVGNPLTPDYILFPELKQEIALLQLSESLLTKIPRDLIFNFILSKKLNARFVLVLASSVRHSANLFVQVSGEPLPDAEAFNARIDELRSMAIVGEHDENFLRELVAESANLSFKMVEQTQTLWENMIGKHSVVDAKYHGYYETRMCSGWNGRAALEWSASLPGRLFRSIELPSWAAFHLSLLAHDNSCLFSRHVKHRSTNLPEIDAPAKLISAAREMAIAKSEYILFGLNHLNYAGSLGITHGCGEGIFRRNSRPVLKVCRAALRKG